MTLLLLIVAATTALLAIDAGCYLWLRANNARRASPVPHIVGSRKLRVRSA